MPALPTERVTTALIAMLESALSIPVGDHGTTRGADGEAIDTTGRYAFVERLEGGGVTGSYGDPHQDVTLVYQITSAGRSRNQAEGTADEVRAAMVDIAAAGGHVHELAGDGWRGGLREQRTEGSPRPEGIDEEGSVAVWTQREQFVVPVYGA